MGTPGSNVLPCADCIAINEAGVVRHAEVDAEKSTFWDLPCGYSIDIDCDRGCASSRAVNSVSNCGAGSTTLPQRYCGLARPQEEGLLPSRPTSVRSRQNGPVRLPRRGSAKRQPALIARFALVGRARCFVSVGHSSRRWQDSASGRKSSFHP